MENIGFVLWFSAFVSSEQANLPRNVVAEKKISFFVEKASTSIFLYLLLCPFFQKSVAQNIICAVSLISKSVVSVFLARSIHREHASWLDLL